MTSNPLVLTFDFGTQSARAMLFNKEGKLLHKCQEQYEKPYYSLKPGWAEQRADFYYEALCRVSKGLKVKAGEHWDDIIAVTLTTMRDCCICVDKEGVPLRDMILWLDTREAKCEKPVPPVSALLFKLVRMTPVVESQRKTSPCNWIMEEEPDIWEKTHKFLFLSGYLTYRLCGELVDSDASMIGHIPFDYKRRGWLKKGEISRCLFDIPEEKLTPLLQPGDTLGVITQAAAEATGIPQGLPLIATGSDKGCETLGLSCVSSDKAAISFGTTATVQIATDKYVEPEPFVPAYPAVLRKKYNPEVQVYRGYWLISWFKKEFAAKEVEEAKRLGVSAESLLDGRLNDVPPGCDGLILQPYFTPGVTMPDAKGAMIGFSDIHTRIHIYRAIIEGINFSLMEGLKLLEKRSGNVIREIYLAGGGAQSDMICQITADMFGMPVYRIQTHEVSGLGSSMVAFVEAGVFSGYDEAIGAMVHVKDCYKPNMENYEFYKVLYDGIFTKIFAKLKPLYHQYNLLAGKREK